MPGCSTSHPTCSITNLRLEAYNGLHLVHLAAATRTRCIVFSTHDDLGLARDAQAAGAFFELPARLPQVLESYVNATLPHHDRRDIRMLGQLPLPWRPALHRSVVDPTPGPAAVAVHRRRRPPPPLTRRHNHP